MRVLNYTSPTFLITQGKNPNLRVSRKTELHFDQKLTIRTPEQASLPPVCSVVCRLTGSSSNRTL